MAYPFQPELQDTDADGIRCPMCERTQDESECFLGQLGWLTHYRCRYCGITFSQSPLSRDIAALSDAECVSDCEACAGDAHSQLASYYTPDQGGEA